MNTAHGAAGFGRTIRVATATDREAVIRSVSQAFAGDPAWGFLLGGDYARHAPLFAAALFDARVEAGTVWLSDDCASVAMWEGPDRSPYTGGAGQRIWAAFEAAIGAAARARVRAYNEALAALAPSRPHWYLGTLATAPAAQRQGLASAVLAPALAAADSQGLDCCLETSTEANRRFYEGRGFTEVIDVVVRGGPPTWWLTRPPLRS